MQAATSQDHAQAGQSRLSLDDAAAAFAKRRDSAGAPRTEASVEDQQARQRAPVQDPSEVADLEVADQSAEDESSEGVSEQEEAQEGEEDSGPLALSEDQVVRLPDGTELPVAEITRGLLREADYTQKTQALAERRKVMDDVAQRLSYQLAAQRQQAMAALQPFQGIDWAAEFEKDPQEYQRKRLRFDQAREKAASVQRGEQEFLQHAARVQEVEAEKRREHAVTYLTKNYPGGWTQGEYNSLLTYAVEQGWSKADVESWDDPQVFLMLRKARAFDEARKVGTKKVVRQSAGQTLKSTRGAAPRKTSESQRTTDLQSIRGAPSRQSALRQAAQLLSSSRKPATRPR